MRFAGQTLAIYLRRHCRRREILKIHVSAVMTLVSTDAVRDSAKALVAGAARLTTADRKAKRSGISNKHR